MRLFVPAVLRLHTLSFSTPKIFLTVLIFIALSLNMYGQVDGGTISTTDPTEICAGDGINDPIAVTLVGDTGTHSSWVITDPDGIILGLPPGPPFDLEGAGAGVCLIWHLSHEDDLTGLEEGASTDSLLGTFDFSNAITVTRTGVNGGFLTTSDATTICTGDSVGDPIDVTLENAVGANEAWIITDQDSNILAMPEGPPFDLEGAPPGVCIIFHLRFEDSLTLTVGTNINDVSGCLDFSNGLVITRLGGETDGGTISTTDSTSFCATDGSPDLVNVTVEGNLGTNSAWVITDENGKILGLPETPPFDFEGAGPGVCLIWHLSYEDGLVGLAVDSNTAALQGCFTFSNSIAVTRTGGVGGEISTTDATSVCVGDGTPDLIDVTVSGNMGANSGWIITDEAGNILGLPDAPPFDFDGAGTGVCLIRHISYEDGLSGMQVDSNIANLMGCYGLSNSIAVNRGEVNGGEISTQDEVDICVGDGIPNLVGVSVSGNVGTNAGWIITDPNGIILGLPEASPFDFDGAGTGICLIWHISYEEGVTGLVVGSDADSLMGCFALSNAITVNRTEINGGMISTTDETTICTGDGTEDLVNVTMEGGNVGANSAWVITDEDGNILGLPDGPPFDFEEAGPGVCLIWHMSYDLDLQGLEVGSNVADLQGCYAFSNSIAVTRRGPDECGDICSPPSDVSVTELTYYRAVIDWEEVPGALRYGVQVRREGRSRWSHYFIALNSHLKMWVHQGYSYEFRVRSVCRSSISAWGEIGSFEVPYRTSSDLGVSSILGSSPLAIVGYLEDLGPISDDVSTLSFTESTRGHTTLSVYPNPVKDLLHLEFNSEERWLEARILNLQGQVVFSQELYTDEQHTVVDVNKLPAGTYFLAVNNGKRIQSLKFLKK